MRSPLLALVLAVATVASLSACAPGTPRLCTDAEVAAIFGGIFVASDVQTLGEFAPTEVLSDTTCAGSYELPAVDTDDVIFVGGTYAVAVVGGDNGGGNYGDSVETTMTGAGFTQSEDDASFTRWTKGDRELTVLALSSVLAEGVQPSLGDPATSHLLVVTGG